MAVCGAAAEVVVGADPEAAGGVDVRRVGVGAGEVGGEAVVREDGVDEEGVGVAQDAQLAPEGVGGLDGGGDVRGQRRRPQAADDVLRRLARRVQLAQHRILQQPSQGRRSDPWVKSAESIGACRKECAARQ